MVEVMLEVGIIRPSQSSYSAPMGMVHNKEGSWHMCPYYKDINKITIKDMFPIPIIDELLDELYGDIYFTKIDIHSGYHQIRMKEEDNPRTTFRTHEGHYEFFIMPFGTGTLGTKIRSSSIDFFVKKNGIFYEEEMHILSM